MEYVDFFRTLNRIESTIAFFESHKDLKGIADKVETLQSTLSHFGSLERLTKMFEEVEQYSYLCKEFLSIEEAAKYLGVSKGTMYHITGNNLITYYKPSGRNIFIARKDLNEYIQSAKFPSKDEINDSIRQKTEELNLSKSSKLVKFGN